MIIIIILHIWYFHWGNVIHSALINTPGRGNHYSVALHKLMSELGLINLSIEFTLFSFCACSMIVLTSPSQTDLIEKLWNYLPKSSYLWGG